MPVKLRRTSSCFKTPRPICECENSIGRLRRHILSITVMLQASSESRQEGVCAQTVVLIIPHCPQQFISICAPALGNCCRHQRVTRSDQRQGLQHTSPRECPVGFTGMALAATDHRVAGVSPKQRVAEFRARVFTRQNHRRQALR